VANYAGRAAGAIARSAVPHDQAERIPKVTLQFRRPHRGQTVQYQIRVVVGNAVTARALR